MQVDTDSRQPVTTPAGGRPASPPTAGVDTPDPRDFASSDSVRSRLSLDISLMALRVIARDHYHVPQEDWRMVTKRAMNGTCDKCVALYAIVQVERECFVAEVIGRTADEDGSWSE